MIGVRHFLTLLQNHLNNKFPELKASFYVSKKNENIHMGLDIALFSLIKHDQVIVEIKNFRINSYDIDKHFKFVFLQHIECTRWKYDYIFMKKKLKFSQLFSLFSILI